MTAPTIGSGTASTDSNTTFAPTLPVHASGDLVGHYVAGYQAITGSTGGFSQLFVDGSGGGSLIQALYWKVAAGSSEALTLSCASSDRWCSVPFKVTAGTYDPAGPWDTVVHSGSGSSTNPIVPTVTPSGVADRVWLEGFVEAVQASPATPTKPTPHTLLAVASQAFLLAAAGYKTHLVGTATGTDTWTDADNNAWLSFSALINPVSGGGGGGGATVPRVVGNRRMQEMS